MTTYVVGDIQGCFEPFKCLLDQVGFNEDSDTLWAVGDVINRGPDNRGNSAEWIVTYGVLQPLV